MNSIRRRADGHLVYLDHAATTWPKPPSVMRAVERTVRERGGNPGRSGHRLAMGAADAVFEARERVSELLHTSYPERVVFTQNATYALNMAIKTFAHFPAHVLISDLEHNAVLRPIEAMRARGLIDYSVFKTDGDVRAAIRAALRPDTAMLVSTLASNVSGREIPIELLCEMRQRYGLYTVVDASQLLGHADIDLSAYPVDVFCAPGHKALFGLQGCGIAVFSEPPPATLIEGGSGSESREVRMPLLLPERMEAGTLPTPSIASLSAGIDFILQKGIENIEQKVRKLTDQLGRELQAIQGVSVVDRVGHGIVSFRTEAQTPERLAMLLDEAGICVRAGLQCAPLAHATFGTGDTGAVRMSVSYLTTEEELAYALRALFSVLRTS